MPACTALPGNLTISNTSEAVLDGWVSVGRGLTVLQYEGTDNMTVRSNSLRNISCELAVRSIFDPFDRNGRGYLDLLFPVLEYMGSLYVGHLYRGVRMAFGPNTTVGTIVHIERV